MAARSGRTVNDLRRSNRAAVLRRLYFDGPMSRQTLGPATGLSSGTISNVVGDLLADGLVEEAGSVDSDGGRPRILLRVAPAAGYLIGVDVGETRVRVELFDLALTELARRETPVTGDEYDVDHVVGHVRDGVHDVLRQAGVTPDRLAGVGVGVPGIVAAAAGQGAVVHGQTIGWDAVPLEQRLRAACGLPSGVPFLIENGARTLGQAEMWFGAGRGAASAAVVLLGSGVGACLVTDVARQGRALEWGHLTIAVGGRRCRCGAPGCLEAYAGAAALIERWREAGGRVPAGADEETALGALADAAFPAAGGDPDPAAAAVLARTAEYLGAGLSGLINLFQPERVLVGGWAGLRLGARFLADVRAHALAYSMAYPAARVTIGLGALGPDAVTVGAATLPLAGLLDTGGRPEQPAREAAAPGWQAAIRGRVLT
ncbi:ROK family transcriptional regulator [Streptomyces coeruleoprunus]|uniref:ROK family transcriptional regulator n=1 Tax=Streptomyces coeruleoprunus TaxID=285563 RepID=A0ABV9XB49_9ACTN